MISTTPLSRRFATRRKRAAALAVLAGLLAACSSGNKPSAGPQPSSTVPVPAACTPIRSPEILGRSHIPEGTTTSYNTTPPTSGTHWPAPAVAGIYDEPLQNEREVHNLEHGHVLIQYHDITDDQVSLLEAVVKADPRMMVLAPYRNMDAAVALTAWGKIQTCSAWDPGIIALVKEFVRLNRDHAPESIP
jgi:hypothetical protein